MAGAENGFTYDASGWQLGDRHFELPVTVYRPFFDWMPDVNAGVGEAISVTATLRVPAAGVEEPNLSGITFTCEGPAGMSFDAASQTMSWTAAAPGDYRVSFIADDGVLPVCRDMVVHVK